MADATTGWTVAAENRHWSGWPLAAAIESSGVSAATDMVPGFIYRTERLRTELAFLHPTKLSIRAGGSQSIEAQGVPRLPFAAARADLTADLTGGEPLQAHFAGLEAVTPSGPLRITAATLTLQPGALVADIAGLAPPNLATPIETVHLDATLSVPLPPADTPRGSAEAWRRAGGRLQIAQALVHWDRLEATGSGAITLDEHLQPRADGWIEANGLPQLLDDLARAGALAPAQAGAAKAVVAILAAPSGGKTVRLPVSLESGVLRLANFPLVRFPPLIWD